jgi:hypothetical protein
MPVRTTNSRRKDDRGHTPRDIGWKRNQSGKLVQHKFRIKSRDEAEVKRRIAKLEELWLAIETEAVKFDWEPLWNELTLDIGRHIADGDYRVVVPRGKVNAPDVYARYINRLQNSFPMVAFAAELGEEEAYHEGAEQAKGKAMTAMRKRLGATRSEMEEKLLKVGGLSTHEVMNGLETLFEALDEYAEQIKRDDVEPGFLKLTDTGHTRLKNVDRLKERHANVPLSTIMTFDAVQALIDVWRNRPIRKNSDPPRPVTKKTAEHHISELMRFLRWLNRSAEFQWRKPPDFDELNLRVRETPHEKKTRNGSHTQVATYSIKELCLLNEYATPNERVLFLLGLNCGFGPAEQGRLELRDLYLDQLHPHYDVLTQQSLLHGFEGTPQDSFLLTARPKTGIPGEWLLWQQTVEAIKWARKRREKLGNATPDSLLLVTDRGTPYLKQTSGGNRSQNFTRRWQDLTMRIQNDYPSFPSLSFGKLRKTAANLVRQVADGEVAGIFLCHGSPVKSDDLIGLYTDIPFPKVFNAQRRLEEVLQPVFEAAPEDLFAQPTQQYTSLKKIKRIFDLKSDGKSVRQIAEDVGLSKSAVFRHLKAKQSRTSKVEKE